MRLRRFNEYIKDIFEFRFHADNGFLKCEQLGRSRQRYRRRRLRALAADFSAS